MDINITLIDLKENPHFVVPEDGSYIVRRPSTITGVSTDIFKCHVKRHKDTKRNIWLNHYDCNDTDQITHVSSQPLK
jgi:hypothetical protein